ncbi:MAG TPA: hypothetical protein VFB72_11115 [Verrucomicrobiae bacterium]|nr:hypothetical protein [Verrucomicrobiae bacterium]
MKKRLLKLLLLLGMGAFLAGCETTYQSSQNFDQDFPPAGATMANYQ